jgi:hypothetical protein
MFGPQGPNGPGQFTRPLIVNTQNGPGPLVQTYIQTGTQDFSGTQPRLSGSQSLRFFNGVTTLTNTGPLILFNNTTQSQSGAGSLVVAQSGSQTQLAGPLLQANNSTLSGSSNILTVLGTLSSSTGNGFVALNQSTVSVGGIAGVLAGTSLTLNGPLLTTLGGNLTLTNDILSVSGAFRITSAAALAIFIGTTVNLSGSGTDVASVNGGTLTLNGPLLALESGSPTVTANGFVLNLPGGGTYIGPNNTTPLVTVKSGTLTVNRDMITIGPGGKVSLGGPLLAANGGTARVDGAILKAVSGSTLTSTLGSPIIDLVQLVGGTHNLANVPSPGGTAMYNLTGAATATEVAEGVTLAVGTERVLRGTGAGGCSGPCFTGRLANLTGATLNTQQVLKLDTALLEASQPLLLLSGGSTLQTGTDAFALAKAKLSLLSPAISLNNGTVNVQNGSLYNIGGSLLSVNNDFINLTNGGTINIVNGFLINISGTSVFVVNGALANFNGSTSNSITVRNSNAPNFTSGTYSFIRVLLVNGAVAGQVTLSGTLARNGSAANFSFPNGGSLIRLDGPNAKIVLKGN